MNKTYQASTPIMRARRYSNSVFWLALKTESTAVAFLCSYTLVVNFLPAVDYSVVDTGCDYRLVVIDLPVPGLVHYRMPFLWNSVDSFVVDQFSWMVRSASVTQHAAVGTASRARPRRAFIPATALPFPPAHTTAFAGITAFIAFSGI